MPWRMKAKYYEACNCALGCPCNMDGYPTHGFCEGAIGFHVVEGERDGVDLAGAGLGCLLCPFLLARTGAGGVFIAVAPASA